MPHTDTASLLVPADPTTVWTALTTPAARATWLPPTGMTGRFDSFDLRPGGSYRMVLRYDDPSEPGKAGDGTDVVEARFLAVDPPHSVVEQVDFDSPDPDFAGTMTMTWQVESADGGSLVSVVAEDVPDGIASEDHQAAFASTLANLAAHVAP